MPRFAANVSMLFTELPFLDRFAAARKAGFAAVECQFPYAFEAKEIAARLADNGLEMALHNMPGGDWEAGERGLAVLADREAEFQDGVSRAIDYAGALGCRQINCLAGVAPAGVDPARLRALVVENLTYAAAELHRVGLRMLVEAINTRDIPGFYLNRSDETLRLIAEIGADNLFLQYDAYHMQVMEGDLARTIERNLARIGHIQIADNPGRHEPGTGEINWPFLFAHLDRIGYAGWVGAEYLPLGRTDEGLAWLADAQGFRPDGA
ncbi:hydroxypyruvate isomerase [Methylopila sp. M107]|uniref:hydroxypyruvate isomerase n=1 Tax=Methylopila sp. M107 TaxID=1101190 RepID=UPI000379111A|nr:hydroxypyruvate isomerase [Methylopila sp. M107]